jgi:hypothetical protein
MTDVLQTSVGEAVVRHRLLLAVECRDALSDRPVGSPVEVCYRWLPTNSSPNLSWHPLSPVGLARFTLRHRIIDDRPQPTPRPPRQMELMVDDRSRSYVPRRFTVTPWTYAEVKEPAPYVPVQARLLRVWLMPGTAYRLPRTASVIRGRVALADKTPVRWARIEGRTQFSVAGWTHADERGEFVLLIGDPGYDPVRDYRLDFDVTLVVVAPKKPVKPDPEERTVDLVSELIPRLSLPPLPWDPDSEVLRGTAVPLGYARNLRPDPQVTVSVGTALNLTADVIFAP